MNLVRPVHQMNALSHLGFLIQMYISHLDDLKQRDELHQLKRQKEQVESMHHMAREQVVQKAEAEAAPGPNVSSAKKNVSFQAEASEAQHEELPKCHLDLSFLPDDTPESPTPTPAGPASLPASPVSAATVFKLKSFVIPRMKSRLSRKSLTPTSPDRLTWTARSEPGGSSFDWGLREESW